MLILGLIVFGMAIGWIAQLILGKGGRTQRDWAQALGAGLIGSFVGGLLSSWISGDGIEFRMSGVIGSIVGAVIVVAVWNAIRARTS
jgi:uncharacterized membrane protein YeaQ/YmgE (transglycosylase-associated protein family)